MKETGPIRRDGQVSLLPRVLLKVIRLVASSSSLPASLKPSKRDKQQVTEHLALQMPATPLVSLEALLRSRNNPNLLALLCLTVKLS